MNDQKMLTFSFVTNNNIPNSSFPLVIYKNVFASRGDSGAEWLETHFQKCGWSNSWRNGVFPYHHYHSITHEVMGVYSGNDILQFGGPDGQQLAVEEGDVIVIPAGVGHKNIRTSHTLKVVGAYPEGMEYDVMLATPSDYKKACANLREVPFPTTDPVFGTDEGICRIWKNFESSS